MQAFIFYLTWPYGHLYVGPSSFLPEFLLLTRVEIIRRPLAAAARSGAVIPFGHPALIALAP